MVKDYVAILVTCFAAILILGGGPLISAQETNGTNATNTTLTNSVVGFTAEPAERDHLGTDVSYAFKFTVDFIEEGWDEQQPYVIVYYINNDPVEQFDHVLLPYEFVRNFKGMDGGTYTIRIDIEDDEGNVLASKTTEVVIEK